MDPKLKEKKFKGKGKRLPRKEDKREKDPKLPKEDKPYKGHNNIAWRTADETMTELVARLPFGLASGLGQEVNEDRSGNTTTTIRTPGILSIRTRLTAGGVSGASGYNTAINLASRKLYSYIRHANSGSKNYEAADLSMYLLSIQHALGLLGWIQRLYRIVNMYSVTNRYTPVQLMRTMGVDPDDFIANQPQLKYLIAWFGRAVGALAFPDLRIMHASYEAYKWIIRDADSPKEQFYIIDSAGFAKYDPVLTTVGGGVTYTTSTPWANPNSPISFQTLYLYVHEIMDVLLSDEDIGIISGDILKAYRDSGLFQVEAFGEYDVFIKDDEVLQQIHNCHVVPEADCKLQYYEQLSGGTSTAPYVQPNFLTNTVNVSTTNVYCYGHNLFIDAFSKIPDAKEVVNCTVLNPCYDLGFVVGANQVHIDATKLSFDLHLPVAVFLCRDLSSTIVDLTGCFNRWLGLTSTVTTYENVGLISSFDWHPFVFKINFAGPSITGRMILGDRQNSRFFTREVGVRIHENSILSLLNFEENNFNDKGA